MKTIPDINIDSLGSVFYFGQNKIMITTREREFPYSTVVRYEYEKIFVSKEAKIFVFKMNTYAKSKCWALGLDPACVAQRIIDQQVNDRFDMIGDSFFKESDFPFVQLPEKKFIYTYSKKSGTIIDISFE